MRSESTETEKGGRGFTLVELLVVISIIGLLAGLIMYAVMGAKSKANARAVRSVISQLETAISTYSNDWGDFPPSTLKILPGGYDHGFNSGNEALVHCLSSNEKGTMYFDFTEEKLENVDKDTGANISPKSVFNQQLFEYTDMWGNPFVYFHNRDYAKPSGLGNYKGKNGDFVAVPQVSAKTKIFHKVDSYQIWSIGSNMINENGGGDDINNWD